MKQPRIAAIILAAGAATRFGSPKQLASFRGEPMLIRTIRHAREAGVSHMVVVLGAHANVIRPALALCDGVIIVLNHEWSTGIASSIRAGLAAIPADSANAVLLLTTDQPLIGGRDLVRMIDAFASGSDIIAAEYYGVIGIPALVATEHIADLTRAVSGDRGAAAWLRSWGKHATRVRMDVAASDADTVEALRAMERRNIHQLE